MHQEDPSYRVEESLLEGMVVELVCINYDFALEERICATYETLEALQAARNWTVVQIQDRQELNAVVRIQIRLAEDRCLFHMQK